MPRIPKITIHRWTTEGAEYVLTSPLPGRRHRKDHQPGVTEDIVEHPGAQDTSEASSMLVFAYRDLEVWAFNRGHVYEVDIVVDDVETATIHVDAREDYALETFKNGIELAQARGLSDDELAELLDDIEDPYADQGDDLDESSAVDDAESHDEDEHSIDSEDAVGDDYGKLLDEEE